MLLSGLCPCVARRLAGFSTPLLRVSRGSCSSRLSSAALSMTSDDADEPQLSSEHGRRRAVAYVESSRSRRVYLERFLRHELGLSWARAEREAGRCGHLAAAGLPLMAENLAFLTEHGVQRRHLQDDVDVLGVAHGDLLRVHGLVSDLPDADYCQYYPLSRARPDTVSELFRRLLSRRTNLVHQLSEILRLPELTVSRAVSRMASQITKSSNNKLLSNARLLMELDVPPVELSRSLYLLRLSGSRLRHRQQQCLEHGIPLLGRYLGMSDDNFQRRVTRGGRLWEQTADVEAAVADRLGASRDQVLQQTRHSDALGHLTAARFEAVTVILEEAGYSTAELVSALLTAYRSRPERLQQRLELSRQLGQPRPSLALLASGKTRFERSLAKWRRQAALQDRGGAELRGGQVDGEGEVGSDPESEGSYPGRAMMSDPERAEGSDPETEGSYQERAEGSDVDKIGDFSESDGELRGGDDSEGELQDREVRTLQKDSPETKEATTAIEEGIEASADSTEESDRLLHAAASNEVKREVQTELKTKDQVKPSSEIEEKKCAELYDDPEYFRDADVLGEENISHEKRGFRKTTS